MQNIEIMVRELGAEIQHDPRYMRFQLAKVQNDADEALQELIGQFNLLRVSANAGMSEEQKDEKKLDQLNAQIRQVYEQIMQNPNMAEYEEAKQELDSLMNYVSSVLVLCANGEDPATCEPGGCGGSCSSCAGCN